MAFFKTFKDEKSLQESSFDYIKESGIYDIKIKFASVNTNSFGARSIDFNCSYKGSDFTLWGLKLDNNDLSPNYQQSIFNKLCVVAGLDSVKEPVKRVHKVGKENLAKEFLVLEDFDDLEVKVRIVYVYSKYQGEIREQREIRNFYRASDGASASEIALGLPAGKTLAKDEAYKEAIYKDGLTKEDIIAWKENRVLPKDTSLENPF